jgi:hypothetical protein
MSKIVEGSSLSSSNNNQDLCDGSGQDDDDVEETLVLLDFPELVGSDILAKAGDVVIEVVESSNSVVTGFHIPMHISQQQINKMGEGGTCRPTHLLFFAVLISAFYFFQQL